MKKSLSLTILSLILLLPIINAQNTESDIAILKSIGDKLIENSSFKIIDNNTGEVYTSIKPISPGKSIGIESRFNHWKYSNGVINLSMMELGRLTGENIYINQAKNFYSFFFDHSEFLNEVYKSGNTSWDFTGFFRMGSLDECGALGAGLLEVIKEGSREEYVEYLQKAADFMENDLCRLDDGTFSRLTPYEKTIWLDDLYMSVPFLARMAVFTGKDKYFDLAVKQVIQFDKYLWDEEAGLFYHCYFQDLGVNGVARWGRANGWALMAQVNLLEFLPGNHPDRPVLISILNRHIVGISRFQSQNGLWHQLLDKQDSYLETSCSSMFTFTIAKAINNDWIDERYASVALKGWEGIKSRIDDDYNILGTCQGTGIRSELAYYYERPTPVNDFHGIGATVLAGCEIIKLKQKIQE